ncbi:MAG: hypothetical protein IJC48_08360 [Clostridia bacterium]|nr:hypothetical protein [Clostridia bacterium]
MKRREFFLAKKIRRMQKRRMGLDMKKMNPAVKKSLIALVLVLAVVLALFTVSSIRIGQANKLFKAGDYEAAAAKYDDMKGNWFYKGKAADKWAESYGKAAEKAIEDKNFDRAIEIYTDIGAKEEVKNARSAYADYAKETGDYEKAAVEYGKAGLNDESYEMYMLYAEKCVEEGDYANAVETYKKYNEQEKIVNVRTLWAEKLYAEKDYDGASEQYKLMGDTDKAIEVLCDQAEYLIGEGENEEAVNAFSNIMTLCSETGNEEEAEKAVGLIYTAVKEASAENSGQELETALAGFGKSIRNLDMQLMYCAAMSADGIDLNLVYPDGVEVDQDLKAYQMLDIANAEYTGALDTSKMLIFTRTEKEPKTSSHRTKTMTEANALSDTLNAKKKTDEYSYTVKLEPALMLRLAEDMRAESFDECTSFILVEKGYLAGGSINEKSTSSGYGSFTNTSYTSFPEYIAFETISVYDKNDPAVGIIMDGYENAPRMAHAISGNAYSDTNVGLAPEQIEEIQNALSDSESESAKAILAKYTQKQIDFVAQNGWGNYLLVYYYDENGNNVEYKANTNNIDMWNTPFFMVAEHNEEWFTDSMIDETIFYLDFLVMFSGIE